MGVRNYNVDKAADFDLLVLVCKENIQLLEQLNITLGLLLKDEFPPVILFGQATSQRQEAIHDVLSCISAICSMPCVPKKTDDET